METGQNGHRLRVRIPVLKVRVCVLRVCSLCCVVCGVRLLANSLVYQSAALKWRRSVPRAKLASLPGTHHSVVLYVFPSSFSFACLRAVWCEQQRFEQGGRHRRGHFGAAVCDRVVRRGPVLLASEKTDAHTKASLAIDTISAVNANECCARSRRHGGRTISQMIMSKHTRVQLYAKRTNECLSLALH